MSRSSLVRQELQQRRNAAASSVGENLLQNASSSRVVKANEVPLVGNPRTYNINTMLFENIQTSSYFRSLYNLTTYHQVVDEIYYRVDHAGPLSVGTSRVPSTCFCCLLKCFTMRLTVKQLSGMLSHTDSPFIRVIGILYVRFAASAEDLLTYLEPLIDDDEEFKAFANNTTSTTIGKFVKMVLTNQKYDGTILPRIPTKTMEGIQVAILRKERKKAGRGKDNKSLAHLIKPGVLIKAMYSDEDNPVARMYNAKVLEIINEQSNKSYRVVFPEYGNEATVSLEDLDLKPLAKNHDDHRRKNYEDERDDDDYDSLLKQVKRRDRFDASSSGGQYAKRPVSYKDSLSLRQDGQRGDRRRGRRSRSRSPDNARDHCYHRSRIRERRRS